MGLASTLQHTTALLHPHHPPTATTRTRMPAFARFFSKLGSSSAVGFGDSFAFFFMFLLGWTFPVNLYMNTHHTLVAAVRDGCGRFVDIYHRRVVPASPPQVQRRSFRLHRSQCALGRRCVQGRCCVLHYRAPTTRKHAGSRCHPVRVCAEQLLGCTTVRHGEPAGPHCSIAVR